MLRGAACVLAMVVVMPAFALAGADPDGRYSGRTLKSDGKPSKTKVSFRVSKDGRRITKLKTTSVAFCIGGRIEDNRIAVLSVYIPKIKVGADGRFEGTSKPTDDTEFKYKGRRVGRRVRGEVDVRVATCFSDEKFRAKRAGP